MGKFSVILFISALSLAAASGDLVEWLSEKEHDFGDIEQGKPITHAFTFRNTADTPIVIDNVRTSCGCTTPNWTRNPIPPDSTAIIEVEYDARDAGYFRKYVKIYLRGQRKAEKLYIKGFVLGEEE